MCLFPDRANRVQASSARRRQQRRMHESSELDALLPEPVKKLWKYGGSHGDDAGEVLAAAAAASGSSSAIRFYAGSFEQPPPSDAVPPPQPQRLPQFMSAALRCLKDELNTTKGCLSRFEIGKWSAHTSHTQPSRSVAVGVSREYNAELCTNAWCKMYEILATVELVDHAGLPKPRGCPRAAAQSESEEPAVTASDAGAAAHALERWQQQRTLPLALSSVHLCEAPGAFVCALNHFLKTAGFQCEHSWLASTLNPWYEGNRLSSMICDDRFILHTQEHWCFGKDQSGDLLNVDNLQHIVSEALHRLAGPVMLVTADGSFDCQDEPAEQEQLVYPLLAAEVYGALLLLADGGSFVLKTFTAFETETTVLVYLLTVAFEEVIVFKPMTSKPGNSELYTICRGYRGAASWMTGSRTSADAADAFKAAIERGLPILDPLCLPAAFLAQHVACCQAFKLWQEETILSNMRLYKMPWSKWRDKARERQQHCWLQFGELCRLTCIDDDQKITGSLLSHRKQQPSARTTAAAAGGCTRKRLAGSLEERSRQASMPWRQYVNFVGFYDVPPATGSLCWIETSRRVLPWSVVTGKSLEYIGSSKFCDHELVEELLRFTQHAAELPVSSTSLTSGSGLYDDFVQQLLVDPSMHSNGKAPAIVKVDTGSSLDSTFDRAVDEATSARAVIPADDLDLVFRIESTYDWLELENRSLLLTALLTVFKCIGHSVVTGSSACDCDDDEDADSGARRLTVVLPFSTLLTRFSVDCLYVLWNCFEEVSCAFADDGLEFAERPPGPLLHLCCRGRLSRCWPQPMAGAIEQHLLDVSSACDSAVTAIDGRSSGRQRTVNVLEFIPIKTLLEDEKFMTFVLTTNRVAVKRLVNWLLAREQLTLASMDAIAGADVSETPDAAPWQ